MHSNIITGEDCGFGTSKNNKITLHTSTEQTISVNVANDALDNLFKFSSVPFSPSTLFLCVKLIVLRRLDVHLKFKIMDYSHFYVFN